MKKHAGTRGALAALILLTVLVPLPALAYVDPSVTSYLVQAVVGAAVVIGTVIALYWRRAKKKVQEKLGVEERAAKEQEADAVIYAAQGSPEKVAAADAASADSASETSAGAGKPQNP